MEEDKGTGRPPPPIGRSDVFSSGEERRNKRPSPLFKIFDISFLLAFCYHINKYRGILPSLRKNIRWGIGDCHTQCESWIGIGQTQQKDWERETVENGMGIRIKLARRKRPRYLSRRIWQTPLPFPSNGVRKQSGESWQRGGRNGGETACN